MFSQLRSTDHAGPFPSEASRSYKGLSKMQAWLWTMHCELWAGLIFRNIIHIHTQSLFYHICHAIRMHLHFCVTSQHCHHTILLHPLHGFCAFIQIQLFSIYVFNVTLNPFSKSEKWQASTRFKKNRLQERVGEYRGTKYQHGSANATWNFGI